MARQQGSHIILVKPGHIATLSVPDHREVAKGTLALYAELGERGARLRHPPTNYPWGSRECQVSDPDGQVLRFGSDLRPGKPMGAWLDGDGRQWLPRPDGSWRAVE